MSMINYASREINCKIVYYGPGLGGKTTNLEHIYGKVKPDTRGKLISLAAETERTLADAGVNIEMISTSEVRITCMIGEDALETALRALHDAFELARPEPVDVQAAV